MSEKINVQMAKSISLKNVFEQLGYKFSNRIGQKEFRLFLNKRSSSGQFDTILCNKLFQVLNIDEKSLIPVDNFIEGFLFFENEILRNAESFRIKLAKEQEIYNKILKQCESYKSEKLNAEGFCKNAKIYGQITDINIKKKLAGIKEIIIEVIFNNKKEEFRFKIGDEESNIKKSFEFKPTSRKDHFEFVMKGINAKGLEFDIGSKIFPLSDIASQEEYFVQIIIPEIGNRDKVVGYINATIVLYMSDFKYYENLMKKQEKRLKRYHIAANKSTEYLKYIREIYGELKIMKPDIIVNFNNEKLMKRKGAKLNVKIDNAIEEGVQRGKYYVEYNNEIEIEKKGSPLKVIFNNLKQITNPIIKTKKVVESSHKISYNNLLQQNITKKADQLIKKIQKESININNIPQEKKAKNDIKSERGMNHIRLFSDFDVNEETDVPQDLNKLNITPQNQQIYSSEQLLTEQNKYSQTLESKSNLEKILKSQSPEESAFKNILQTKNEIVQNIPSPPQNIQTKQQNQNIFDIDAYIKQNYNINDSQRYIQQQQQINQSINTNNGLNTQQNSNVFKQNQIQGYSLGNFGNNITTTKKVTTTILQKSQSQVQPQIINNAYLNRKHIEQKNQYNNIQGNKITELDNGSIYQIVNDISKENKMSTRPQTLEPIINKIDYNVSVNKAITNETTNKEIISEKTLPVSYLPEKVKKLIVSDQVTYLPLTTTQKTVSYNTLKPIIHESKAYYKEGDENILNNISLGQNIISDNSNNNSQIIKNSYNYTNNIPINLYNNNNSYLSQNHNTINGGNNLNYYNLNSNNINGNNNLNTSSRSTKVITKRLVSSYSNPSFNLHIRTKQPIIQPKQISYRY